jgi:hypothetical protein
MFSYFQKEERKKMVLDQFGGSAYEEMMFHVRDPIKIGLTYKRVLPGFLKHAVESLSGVSANH